MLCPEDKELLPSILSDMEQERPEQEENWLCQYVVARSFIHAITSSPST